MSVVIHASVFVAYARATETEYRNSREFLSRVVVSGEPIHGPALVLPECAGAIGRLTGRADDAQRMARLLRRIPRLTIAGISTELAEAAAEIAGTCRLRGSDSCYAALAVELGATLVTWDREMHERGASVVTTRSPSEWLEERPS